MERELVNPWMTVQSPAGAPTVPTGAKRTSWVRAFGIFFTPTTSCPLLPCPREVMTGVDRGELVRLVLAGRNPLDISFSRSSWQAPDRKSTRLNSSHGYISYAVFCLKKKKQEKYQRCQEQAVYAMRTKQKQNPNLLSDTNVD